MGELLCEPRRTLEISEAREVCDAWMASWPAADRGPGALTPYLDRRVIAAGGWAMTPSQSRVGQTVTELITAATARWSNPRLVYTPPEALIALERITRQVYDGRGRCGGRASNVEVVRVRVALLGVHPDHGGLLCQWFELD